MLKAGLIAGAVSFVLVLVGAAGLTPFCALCVPLLTGLLAGYLTGMFEKPAPADAMKRGAGAGAIVGGIAILANIIAALINSLVLQNPDLQPNQALGLPASSPILVWLGQFGINICIGLVNIGLNAALGAGGIAIWRNTTGKDRGSGNLEPPATPQP